MTVQQKTFAINSKKKIDWQGMDKVYDAFVTGLRIMPGMWRPHAVWEQVAWVKPPWSEAGYVWLDFPEVLISNDNSFLYAGHGPLQHPAIRHGVLPKIAWRQTSNGIMFERKLPGELAFGGNLTQCNECSVKMELHVKNHGKIRIPPFIMQTCAFLRLVDEFAEYTNNNKFVHVPRTGWMSLPKASKLPDGTGKYRLGWRGGPAVADKPFMVTVGRSGRRMVGMSWFRDTFSIIGNQCHPCMHADPAFPSLEPGAQYIVHGVLVFFEGTLMDFGRILDELQPD
jgi:hypothetical protein